MYFLMLGEVFCAPTKMCCAWCFQLTDTVTFEEYLQQDALSFLFITVLLTQCIYKVLTMVLYGAYSFHIKSKDCMLACTIDLQNSAVEPTKCTGDSKESPFRGTWLAHKRVGVICHGLLSHKGSRTIIALSQYVLEHIPYIDAIVRFDFHGNGESTGYDKWSYGGYVEEVEDLRNVVQFLVRSNASVPILLGHSRAATVVVLYGCLYSDVPRIVSLAGRVNMSQQSSLLFSPEQEALLKQGHSVAFTDKDGHSRTVRCLINAFPLTVGTVTTYQ